MSLISLQNQPNNSQLTIYTLQPKETLMKKTIILFILLCASSLNGMETEPEAYIPPEDVWTIIFPYLSTYDTLKDIMYTIKSASLISSLWRTKIQEIYGNQKKFTELVHILAKKFNKSTVTIAAEFATPTSQQYKALADELHLAFFYRNTKSIPLAINQGVDVNYTTDDPEQLPILFSAIELRGPWLETLEIIELLLAHGANIQDSHPKKGNLVKYAAHIIYGSSFYGGQDRIDMDTLMKFISNTYCASLSEDETKKIKQEYEYHLLSEAALLNITDHIDRKKKSSSITI